MKHKTLTPFTLLLYWLSGTLTVGGVAQWLRRQPSAGGLTLIYL